VRDAALAAIGCLHRETEEILMIVFPLLIFLAVSAAALGLFLLWPSALQRRVQQLARPLPGAIAWSRHAARVARPLARLSAPQGPWEQSPLRLMFLQAGIARPDARLYYFAAKTVLPFAAAAAAFAAMPGREGLLQQLLAVGVAALCGLYAPNWVVQSLRRRRQREIFEHFPDATDLLLVCMEAGLGMDSALNRVAQEIGLSSRALAHELHLTNLELRAGASREQALRHLALRTGVQEIASFALMLKQADRLGTSIGDSLRVYSDELRHKRMVRAEELAARVPTKMLLPLVLCIFPSIILVVMGPAAIQIVRTLMPMLGRGA
jgi:tight adherence protein C